MAAAHGRFSSLVKVLFSLLSACVVLLLAAAAPSAAQRHGPLVPAMFVFGDSLVGSGGGRVDTLPLTARANYYPYGVDFPNGPTGRFSNGLTLVDELARLLGLPLIPAHSRASSRHLLRGLNFASSPAGILDTTGKEAVGTVPFNQQIRDFHTTMDAAAAGHGELSVERSLANCIHFIGAGSNDFLNNYLAPAGRALRTQYDARQFADLLVRHYTQQLTILYHFGARRFVVAGLGPLGCAPSVKARGPGGASCYEEVNHLVLHFNTGVASMVNTLNANFPAARFVYIDMYRMMTELVNNSNAYGFRVTNAPCCDVGRDDPGRISCVQNRTPCPNRREYVYWDGLHPTEAANVQLARAAFSGGRGVAFPYNIRELATINLPGSD